MAFEYAAFLIYSHPDAPWVEVLGHQPSKVLGDRSDLSPGRSWVTRLQQGLDKAPKVIFVATPEVMASPWVKQDRSLWDLSGNPLHLTLMAMLLEDDKIPKRNRARLCDPIFQLLMEGKHRRNPEPMDVLEVTPGVLPRLTIDDRDAEPLRSPVGRLRLVPTPSKPTTEAKNTSH